MSLSSAPGELFKLAGANQQGERRRAVGNSTEKLLLNVFTTTTPDLQALILQNSRQTEAFLLQQQRGKGSF